MRPARSSVSRRTSVASSANGAGRDGGLLECLTDVVINDLFNAAIGRKQLGACARGSGPDHRSAAATAKTRRNVNMVRPLARGDPDHREASWQARKRWEETGASFVFQRGMTNSCLIYSLRLGIARRFLRSGCHAARSSYRGGRESGSTTRSRTEQDRSGRRTCRSAESQCSIEGNRSVLKSTVPAPRGEARPGACVIGTSEAVALSATLKLRDAAPR